MPIKKIISFGFKFPDAPDDAAPGVVVVDVRRLFYNPYKVPMLRARPGSDPMVQAVILQTPNFAAKYQHVKDQVTSPGTEVAFIGCVGGRHRSVFLAEKLGAELGVPVEHRDRDRDRS